MYEIGMLVFKIWATILFLGGGVFVLYFVGWLIRGVWT